MSRALAEHHDVLTAAGAQLLGAPDPVVARRAADLGRILVAEDRDFGPLVLAMEHPKASVVIFLLDDLARPQRIARTLDVLGSSDHDFDGFITNVDRKTIRQRKL